MIISKWNMYWIIFKFSFKILLTFSKYDNFKNVTSFNFLSFVRFQVVGVDSGGLKSERQEEMEFAHPCFLRGNEQLLDQIRRKVS